MALRFPLQVRGAAQFDAQLHEWEAARQRGRGADSKKATQRIKEVARLESLFPRKPFLGLNVPKHLIPRKYAGLGVTNLFRNDLPDGWRLLHTVMEAGGEQAVLLLEALSHPDYDALFGYEGR